MSSNQSNNLITEADGSLTPQELDAAINSFQLHYTLANERPIGNQLVVTFDALQQKVNSYIEREGLDEAEVACCFIHRLLPATGQWYVCLQLATMTNLHQQDLHGRSLYSIEPDPQYRYDILNGIAGRSSLQGDYDPEYFGRVLYTPDPVLEPAAALVLGRNTQSIVLPWMRELLRLCQQNNLEGVPGAQMVLQSIARQPCAPEDALVTWPHSIAFYMRDAQGRNCLGPRDGDLVFHNQAADMAGACPTSCREYHMPMRLPEMVLE